MASTAPAMTNAELRELRLRLGLQVEWCAERVGRVSARAWKFWEGGRNGKDVPVPEAVQRKMLALASAVESALAA